LEYIYRTINQEEEGAPLHKRSAEEILDMFSELAPYFNDAVAEDVGISVIKNGIYIAYAPADDLDLGIKPGESVKEKVSQECLRTGKQIVRLISQEQSPYGIAYVANALPIKEGNLVIGCVTTTQPIVNQEKITSVASD
jgi:hypothetical protein